MTRTIKVKARSLVDGNVENVSLVARGASRLPFRIQKSEDGMDTRQHDLGSLFVRKQEEPKPLCAGVVVPTEKAEAAVAALKADGFEVAGTDKINEKSSFLKFDEEATMEGSNVFGMNGYAAVVHNAKGLKPWPESTDFTENLQVESFYPALWDASYALEETLRNIMGHYETKSAPVDEVQAALTAFSEHIMQMVSNMPDTLFKMDGLKDAVVEEAKTDEDAPAKEAKADKAKTAKVEKSDPDEEDGEGDGEDAGGEGDGGEGEEDGDPAEAIKSDSKDNETLTAMKQMFEDFNTRVSEKFDKLGEEVQAVKQTAEEAKTQAEKADTALNGTVNNNPADDKQRHTEKTQEGTFGEGFYRSGKAGQDGNPIKIEFA